MKKRGVSPLIASVLLIAFVILLFVLISSWVRRSAVEPGMGAAGEKLASSFEAMSTTIEVRTAEISGNHIKLMLSNEGSTIIKGFGVKIIGDKSSDLRQVELSQDLNEFDITTEYIGFDRGKTGDVNKIEITPILGSGIASSATKTKTNLEEDSSLIAYYGFEGNFKDLSGNNDGDNYGATFVDGKLGQAASFDGSNYVDVLSIKDLVTDFTVSFWVKGSSNQGDIYNPIALGHDSTQGWVFQGSSTIMNWYAGDGTLESLQLSNDLKDDEWHHVAASISSIDGRKLYLDGELDNTGTKKEITNIASNHLRIGADVCCGAGRAFNGLIDEVKIYNRALSEEEIKADAMID